jgi:hypothetical protein
MRLINETDFSNIEQLLAELLIGASPIEEAQVLQIHNRLLQIKNAQRGLQNNRAHLLNLTKQTDQ